MSNLRRRLSGAALLMLGLALSAPVAAHADETPAPTTSTAVATTTASPATPAPVTTTAAAGATSVPPSATTTATDPATTTSTTSTTSVPAPVKPMSKDECGLFADVITIPSVEGVHYVIPDFFDEGSAAELAPGTYGTFFLSTDFGGSDGDAPTYAVTVEARSDVDGPAVATFTFTFDATPCPVTGSNAVTATAGCGSVTFVNRSDVPADLLWGDPEAQDADGELDLAPGATVKVSTKRTHLAWVAFDVSALPTDFPTDEPTDFPTDLTRAAGAGASAGSGWLDRMVPDASMATAARAGTPLRARTLAAADVELIDPSFFPDLAELRAAELTADDVILGIGELDVAQGCSTPPTSTTSAPVSTTAVSTTVVSATAGDPELAFTGPAPVARLSLLAGGLIGVGFLLYAGAARRRPGRRH